MAASRARGRCAVRERERAHGIGAQRESESKRARSVRGERARASACGRCAAREREKSARGQCAARERERARGRCAVRERERARGRCAADNPRGELGALAEFFSHHDSTLRRFDRRPPRCREVGRSRGRSREKEIDPERARDATRDSRRETCVAFFGASVPLFRHSDGRSMGSGAEKGDGIRPEASASKKPRASRHAACGASRRTTRAGRLCSRCSTRRRSAR